LTDVTRRSYLWLNFAGAGNAHRRIMASRCARRIIILSYRKEPGLE
jgi:hypothetical protein